MSLKSLKYFSFLPLVILMLFQDIVMDKKCIDIHYQTGERLPVTPVIVLHHISLHVCVRECEFYMFCRSVNFNRKLRKCELNCQKADGDLRLVDDSEFIYGETPGVVSITYLLS
jgi:hypothetical protein